MNCKEEFVDIVKVLYTHVYSSVVTTALYSIDL